MAAASLECVTCILTAPALIGLIGIISFHHDDVDELMTIPNAVDNTCDPTFEKRLLI